MVRLWFMPLCVLMSTMLMIIQGYSTLELNKSLSSLY